MIVFPVHSRRIAAFHYDPASKMLWAAFRNGQIHTTENIELTWLLHMLSAVPLERSEFLPARG